MPNKAHWPPHTLALAVVAAAMICGHAVTAHGQDLRPSIPGATTRDAEPAADGRETDADRPRGDGDTAPATPPQADSPSMDGEASIEARAEADEREAAELEEAANRDREAYEPLGIRVGGFLLFPKIEVSDAYSDNVFLSADDKRADHALLLLPGLSFRSDWSRHELSGELAGDLSYHDRFQSEDDRGYSALLRGRLDITERTKLEAELAHALAQEERSASTFPEGASERADIVTDRAALSGSQRFNRLTLGLRGSVATEDYGSARLEDGSFTSGDERDSTLYRTGARASYEFRPGVSAFMDGAVSKRRFKERFDELGAPTGSSGYSVQAGLAFTLTDRLTGEASAGYARQLPDDNARDGVDGAIFNANLLWQATALTSFRLMAESTIDDVSIDATLNRTIEIGVEHALRRNFVLGAALAYRTEVDAQDTTLSRDWATTLSAGYTLNRSLELNGTYVHYRSIGLTGDDGYTENAVTVGMTLRR